MDNIYQFVVSHKNFNDARFKERKILFVNESVPKDIGANDYKTWDGDNIDNLNENYCELTALYWIWKNINEDCYISLEHYRRVFVKPKSNLFRYSFLKSEEIENILSEFKIILPLKHHFKDTIYDQYKNNHFEKDMINMKNILLSLHPDYKKDYESFVAGHEAVLFNMFITKKDIMNSYCEFAFPIFDEFYNLYKDEINSRDTYQKRVIGFLAERLFNIWINHNFKEDDVFHCPVGHLDQNPTIHYLKEIYFKMSGKDYDFKATKYKKLR